MPRLPASASSFTFIIMRMRLPLLRGVGTHVVSHAGSDGVLLGASGRNRPSDARRYQLGSWGRQDGANEDWWDPPESAISTTPRYANDGFRARDPHPVAGANGYLLRPSEPSETNRPRAVRHRLLTSSTHPAISAGTSGHEAGGHVPGKGGGRVPGSSPSPHGRWRRAVERRPTPASSGPGAPDGSPSM